MRAPLVVSLDDDPVVTDVCELYFLPDVAATPSDLGDPDVETTEAKLNVMQPHLMKELRIAACAFRWRQFARRALTTARAMDKLFCNVAGLHKKICGSLPD